MALVNSSDTSVSLTSQLARISVNDEGDCLDYSGKGLKLDSEKDAQEIAREISKCPKLKTLKLEGNTLGVDAAKCIAKALEAHPEFQRALWKDMFTGRLKTEIPEALMYLSSGLMLAKAHLLELDLSDNALGPIGIEGVQSLLRSSCCHKLQILRLNNNGLGITGGKMLAASLRDCYKATTDNGSSLSLRTFICGRNRLENDGAQALAEFFAEVKTLEEVAMPQNGIHAEGITALAESLSQNKNLVSLNLNDNTFVEAGSKAVAKLILSLKRLEVLNFGDCLVRSDGASAIASALKEGNENLKELHLGFNEIDKDSALCLINSIKDKPHLERLDLDGNKFGKEGCNALRSVLDEYNKLEALGSLSEDEGAGEDDDEDDDDDDDDDDDEEEEDDEEKEKNETKEDEDDDEDGEEKFIEELHHPSPMKSKPVIISQLEYANNEVTAKNFLEAPVTWKLKVMGKDGIALILKEIEDTNDVEKYIEVFYKIGSCVGGVGSDIESLAVEYADAVLTKAFKKAEEKNIMAVLSNSLLVHLGLIKSEDKHFKPIANIHGPLILLEHVVKQQYFARSTKEILQLFLSRPNKAVEACGNAKHKLMQSLYRF